MEAEVSELLKLELQMFADVLDGCWELNLGPVKNSKCSYC